MEQIIAYFGAAAAGMGFWKIMYEYKQDWLGLSIFVPGIATVVGAELVMNTDEGDPMHQIGLIGEYGGLGVTIAVLGLLFLLKKHYQGRYVGY